jgi:hypothetical protein
MEQTICERCGAPMNLYEKGNNILHSCPPESADFIDFPDPFDDINDDDYYEDETCWYCLKYMEGATPDGVYGMTCKACNRSLRDHPLWGEGMPKDAAKQTQQAMLPKGL